jgi:hypothetical protein
MSRLHKSALDAALEEVYKDQQDEASTKDSAKMVHGHEHTAGVDPNLAAKLHDKLAEKAAPEPSGMRAPCTTQVLKLEDLAAADDDDDEVIIDRSNHGKIDQVDSKLVTELNKKLCDEAAHESVKSNGFAGDLSAALDKRFGGQAAKEGDSGVDTALLAALGKLEEPTVEPKNHGTIDTINTDLVMTLQRKLGANVEPEETDPLSPKEVGVVDDTFEDVAVMDESQNCAGLRAPQATVQLSAEALAGLMDDDDEDCAGEKIACENHGAIDRIDDHLVLDLQRKLAGAAEGTAEAIQAAEGAEEEPVGMRAPQNTVMLSAGMLNMLDDEDDDIAHAPVDPQHPSLVAELQQKLEADADDPEDSMPQQGCRAPQATQQLTADMLAGLDDEDIEDVAQPVGAGVSVLEAAAAALNQDALNKEADYDRRRSGEFDPSFAAQLHHQLADQSEEHGGLRAPESTRLITADMLAGLDDEDVEERKDPLADQLAAKLQDASQYASNVSQASQYASNASQSDTTSMKKNIKKSKSISFHQGEQPQDPFAQALANRLKDEEVPESTPEKSPAARAVEETSTQAPPSSAALVDDILAWDSDGNDETEDNKFEGGRRAPQTTQVITADQLAQLDDETFPDDDDDANPVIQSGMKAPQCTAVLTLEQLASFDDDVAEITAPPPTAIAAAAPPNGLDSAFSAKVIQNMRDVPNGDGKPMASSCKLRLAWLSDDEIRKENDQLRREVDSLRSQIEVHRKEAALARKV